MEDIFRLSLQEKGFESSKSQRNGFRDRKENRRRKEGQRGQEGFYRNIIAHSSFRSSSLSSESVVLGQDPRDFMLPLNHRFSAAAVESSPWPHLPWSRVQYTHHQAQKCSLTASHLQDGPSAGVLFSTGATCFLALELNMRTCQRPLLIVPLLIYLTLQNSLYSLFPFARDTHCI